MTTSTRTRRSAGEGGITRRKDGRYQVTVRYQGRTLYAYAKTRAEATRERDTLKRRAALGLAEAGRLAVADWLAAWLEDTVKPLRTPGTYHLYAQQVRNHLVPALGRIRLDELRPADIRRLQARLLADDYAIATVHSVLRVLSAALNEAVRDEVIPRNPALLVKRPPTPKAERYRLNLTDARRLLTAFEGDRYEAIVTVMLFVGLRLGEASGLYWTDVDFGGGLLHVRRQVQWRSPALRGDGPSLQLVGAKAGSERVIPLPGPAAAALRLHRERSEGDGLLFPSIRGGLVSPKTVESAFARGVARSGLPRMTPHDLRHGTASILAALGVPVHVRMAILGHRSVAMAMHYTHMEQDEAEQAMRLLGEAFGSG